jgi:hypothetical protein
MMSARCGLGLLLLAAALGLPVDAQVRAPGYSPPHTPWGAPDLQGVWSNASVTDMQREPGFEALVLTREEAARMEAADYYNTSTRAELKPSDTFDGRLLDGTDLISGGGYNSFWIDQGSQVASVRGTLRSSWIVTPADGRIPYKDPARKLGATGLGGSSSIALDATAFTPTRSQKDPKKLALGGPVPPNPLRGGQIGSYDNPETRPPSERCLVGFGSAGGPVMGNVIYNNRYQIVQTPAHVMILVEMVHDARIIPVFASARDARAGHRPAVITPWLGDSVGWYEDGALVVETVNANPTQRGFISAGGVVTERFSRWSETQVTYEFTVEDSSLYSQPWRGEMALNQTAPWFEYACHEGNYALRGILAGARKLEQEGKLVEASDAEEGGAN